MAIDRALPPEEMRRQAAEVLEHAAGNESFAQAEEILLSALALDSQDAQGRTRYLLGLACFHQERWADAERHLVAAARNAENVLAPALAEQARVNASTAVQRAMHLSVELDPARLLQPPALWLREPRDLQPLAPARRRAGGRPAARPAPAAVDRALPHGHWRMDHR